MINSPKSTFLWILDNDLPLLETTEKEQNISQNLKGNNSLRFLISRGYARKLISDIFNINPLDLPLIALPGEPPILHQNFGFISISHCIDKVLLAWSSSPIGIDIERLDRKILAEKIAIRFFSRNENLIFKKHKSNDLNFEVLRRWVIKESLIKWQKGKLSTDLKKWIIDDNLKMASHSDFKESVKIKTKIYKSWIFSIASKQNLTENENLIIKEIF